MAAVDVHSFVRTSPSSTSSISLLGAEGQGQRALIPVLAETTALTGTKRWNVHEVIVSSLSGSNSSPRGGPLTDVMLLIKTALWFPAPISGPQSWSESCHGPVSSGGSDLYLGMFCCWAIQKRALRTPLSILSNACIPDTRQV